MANNQQEIPDFWCYSSEMSFRSLKAMESHFKDCHKKNEILCKKGKNMFDTLVTWSCMRSSAALAANG
ncbi:hypothetical protein Q3G72_005405 [Acer saccharum]|nr:hypothetical protein Q3G72_005405 [Acer saccharum]